jgi:NAD(P)-dependent dehydrogenase (short-subunit alcohol dehydrogenase family)
MNLVDAAALPLVTMTGSQLIYVGADVKPGQTVLVSGAAGGVGRSAVFAAKDRGAVVIAGVLKKQLDAAKNLSADRVVALDDPAAFADLQSVEVVANTVRGKTAEDLMAKLKPDGTFASVTGAPANAAKSLRCARSPSCPSRTRRIWSTPLRQCKPANLPSRLEADCLFATLRKRMPRLRRAAPVKYCCCRRRQAWKLNVLESIRLYRRAATAAPSALQQADGGCICGVAPNAGMSAVATVLPVNTPRNIFMPPAIRLQPALNRERPGFMTIGLAK